MQDKFGEERQGVTYDSIFKERSAFTRIHLELYTYHIIVGFGEVFNNVFKAGGGAPVFSRPNFDEPPIDSIADGVPIMGKCIKLMLTHT